ncbi:MAG: group I intron-associated PD-(D/E)XK endonuclease [Bacteroidota bacterium]
MYKHHTKIKGDLGVLKAKVDLFEKGYLIFNPETEHAPFDLVVYKEKKFKRIQVKYRQVNKKGNLEIIFRNTYSYAGGSVVKEVDKDEIDLYAVYCPETDEVYYFDPKLFRKSINLRVSTPANNQQKGIHFAADFREVP